MSSIVFILGAGASKQCGAPLMNDFLDVASSLMLTEEAGEKKPDFERVFRTIGQLQAVHSKAQLDLNNLESIFTVLELGRVIQKIPGLAPEEIAGVIASLKELIVKTLELTLRFPVRDRHILPPQPYEQFASLIGELRTRGTPRQSVSVITFNYDVAVDVALYRAGFGPNYIVETSHSHMPIDLMKLHGSLNWATQKETRQIRPLHFADYFGRYHAGFTNDKVILPIGTEHLKDYFSYLNVEVEPEPVIVPPSWNKADYHTALSKVWAQAANHLGEAQYIFVAGYSLPETDSFFRHLYALGCVGQTPLRKFVVFNPDTSGETDRRFRQLLGPGAAARYEYQPLTFGDSIAAVRKMFAFEQRN